MVRTAQPSLDSLSSLPAAPTRKPLVLVIDPDESTRSVLEVALSRDGFEVWSASAGPAGLGLLQGRLPDVIVLESDLGGEDGFTFVAQLRGDDRLAPIPVLLLAKAGDQNVEAIADVMGIDDFIQKPAYARDVAALLRVELARREGPGPLRFETKVLPPVQLLRALMSCPRSGRLLLVGGRAEVRFRSGKIIDARFDAHGGTLETLVRALSLTSGAYELVLEPVDGFAELQCSLREVVDLVLPRLQKWSRVLQRSLPLDARLTVDFARLAQGLKAMPDEVNRIVQLFDGFRSVEQVLLDSTFSETLTLEVATRLYLMGVLSPVKGSEDALVVLRPMPRLFEPRAAEAEELMHQLFAGTAEIRADDSTLTLTDEQDWYPQITQDSGIELGDANGGWTTAPVPQLLAEGLAPELARQLDAFQTPMRVEAKAVSPEAVEAQRFADLQPQLSVDTAMEAALQKVAESESIQAIEAELNDALTTRAEAEFAIELAMHQAQARGAQARIETPWMTPVVDLAPAARPAVEVAASPSEQVEARAVTPPLMPSVIVDPESVFFAEPAAPDAPLPAPKAVRRVWPFIVGALAIAGLALFIESMSPTTVPAPAPVEPPKAAVVVAPVLPEIAPPEFIETEAAADEVVPLVNVSENLDEARKLYESGQFKRAVSVLEQVVTDDPKSVTAWNLLGLAKYDALDSAGARAAADKVLELDPKNARVQILLATLYFDGNQRDLGRAALEKYLELDPAGPHVAEAKALLKR